MRQGVQERTKWSFLKAVFHKFHLPHSWILSLKYISLCKQKMEIKDNYKGNFIGKKFYATIQNQWKSFWVSHHYDGGQKPRGHQGVKNHLI